ncbi:MAG: caspase family protein [Candidatus Aminicenantes bacterium]|nr:caspase family protein [Candidatus Aminicenantes bacterium]
MFKARLVLLILLAVITLSHAQEGRKAVRIKEMKGNSGKRWAICIGINNYEDDSIMNLKNARNDAKELGKVLKQYGQFDRVYVMTDDLDGKKGEYPKLMNIRRKLDFIKEFIKPEDLILIFFSGHGISNSKNEGYLVLADSYIGNLYGSSLKIGELIAWLKKLKVKKSLLLLDACRERFQDGKAINLNGLKSMRFKQAEVAAVFYSTKSGWFSYEDKEGNFGIFTNFLVKGLKGDADNTMVAGNGDGIVSFSELASYVEEGVSNWALDEGRKQRPYTEIYGEKFGDLALSVYSDSSTVLRADRISYLENTGTSFKFPEKIGYKILKNGAIMGDCYLRFKEETFKQGSSSLRFTGFDGMGLTSKDSLITFIFGRDLSIYASIFMKDKKTFSEWRLKEGLAFDGKKGKEFIFKERGSSDEIHRENFIRFKVIDFLSSFLIASQRIQSGKYERPGNFNLILGERVYTVRFLYFGRDEVPFQGKNVRTHVLVMTHNSVEILRYYIYKNEKGACFPVKVVFDDSYLKSLGSSRNRLYSGQRKIYISNLSFIDAMTMSTMANFEAAELINETVKKGMDETQRKYNNLAIKETGHIIPDTDANVNNLVNIVFDPNLTKIEKMNKITDDLMNPHRVDVIVTGQYISNERNLLITVRPMIFVKSGPNMMYKNLQFSKEEFFCTDPITRKRVLCKGAFDQIAQAVKELLEEL